MPTINAGSVATVYCPLASSITITPGSTGRVSFQARGVDGGQSSAPRVIYAAETVSVAAGDTVSMQAIGSSATYTTPAGGDTAVSSLVSGGGIGPSSTWASLPAAADNAGNSYRVTDVGPVGCGSIWISDGTRWRPLNGCVMHCAASGTLAAPLATLSGATGKLSLPAGDRVASGSILLPIGLPQIGQGLQAVAKFRHRGTGGAWTAVARLGTLDSASDSNFGLVTGTAATDQDLVMDQSCEVVSATTFIAPTYLIPNSVGVGGFAPRNTNFNNAAQLYIGFYSSTLNAADFLDLISYRVYILG